MTKEFQYTSRKTGWMLLISYFLFVLIGFGTLIIYGPIESGAKELDYFLIILFGVPVLTFFSRYKVYREWGWMKFYEDSIKINVHGTIHELSYKDITKTSYSHFRGFTVRIYTNNAKIVITSTYFSKSEYLERA